jgi:hypothetical protein
MLRGPKKKLRCSVQVHELFSVVLLYVACCVSLISSVFHSKSQPQLVPNPSIKYQAQIFLNINGFYFQIENSTKL